MRTGVSRDERPMAPHPDTRRATAMRDAQRVATMAIKGEPAPRVKQATIDLLRCWEEEADLSLGDLRRRVETLQAEIDSAVPEVEQFVLDADGRDAKQQAECQLAAVRAMAEAVDAQLEKMRYLI